MVGSYRPGDNALPLWPEGAPEIKDVAPGDGPTLTPFLLPQGHGPAPAIVVCPGGGYRIKAEHEGAPIAEWLNSLGLVAFVVDYRVAPYRHPAPLQDAQQALRLVRANASRWGVLADKVGILGFSAGGHLAATAGTWWDRGDAASDDPVRRESSRPDMLVLCYPVISFADVAHVGSMENLLGPNPAQDRREALSAERNVSAETPPTFLWHTADDEVVHVEHSLRFASALRAHDVPFSLHVFPHGRHGLGLAEDDPVVGAWTSLCASFLQSQGFLTA
ncbi:MAG TPA: alpha/beta hydrolase [Thermomicrobiales bacterium]|nr:alpha/beta hydrolase [Thermomicrobiales bacterium]